MDDSAPHRVRRVGGDAPVASARKVWRGASGKAASDTGSREVIVRVTGRTRSPRALAAQFAYNSRDGALAAEHSSGQVLHGMAELRALQRQWARENHALARNGACPTQSLGVVLSMPAGTAPGAVRAAAVAWAHSHLSPRTEWLAVQHTDRAHPHLHISVRAVQHDGRRVVASPADVQRWRADFAARLRDQGIDADATPQREKVEHLRARGQELHRDGRTFTPPAMRETLLPGFDFAP